MSLKSAERVTLANENNKADLDEWCQRNLSNIPVSVDGGIVAMVKMHSFITSNLGNDDFTSPHNSVIFDKILLCGGANTGYNISK